MRTESKTAEQIEMLMRPRYKVIADYPDNIFPIGEILYQEREGSDDYIGDELLSNFGTTKPGKWPHLFRKLEWHEERRLEEMPEYVKEADSLYKIGQTVRVAEWYMEDADTDVPCFRDEKDSFFTWVRGFLPATESEYLAYTQSPTPAQ